MNPKLKTGIIIAAVSSVTAGTLFGVKKYMDSSATIEVQSVSALNIGYMDNPMTSTGFVSDSDSQSVYYSSAKTITNVYVTQGQQVSAGDPLLSYDLTSLNLAVEADQITVDKAKNTLEFAQHELKKLQNTTPDPDPTPTPSETPEPSEEPEPDPVAPEVPDAPEADENGYYPYIVSLDQAENGIKESKVLYCTKDAKTEQTIETSPATAPSETSKPSESEPAAQEIQNEEETVQTVTKTITKSKPDTPSKDDSEWTEDKPQTVEEDKYYWYMIVDTYEDGTVDYSDPEEIGTENGQFYESDLKNAKPSDPVGSKSNPYVFKISSETIVDEETGETQEGFVYGKLLNDLKEAEESNNQKIYVRFDVYDSEDPTQLVDSWTVEPSKFKDKTGCLDYDRFGLLSHSILEYTDDSQNEEETEEEKEETDYSGYTATELAKAIRDKQQEIKTLDLDYRKAQLALKDDQALLSDGVVYAKRSGVIRKVSDADNPPADGSAFLEVASGTGLSISGTVSELVLDQVKVGDTISGYSWSNGQTYSAEITSIDTYPADDGYYNGTGNPNASYYTFNAYVEDSTDLSVGDYLELTFSVSDQESSSIWLSNAYIRKDGKQSYVYKADETGKLVKQYIETGSILWGEYVEVKSGITESDYIAFPYSKNAKDGTKTTGMEDINAEEASYD